MINFAGDNIIYISINKNYSLFNQLKYEDMGKSFDEYAGLYDAWFLDNRNVLYSEVNLVAATLKGSKNILSVGCGSGLFEKIMRDEYGIDVRKGIEPSEGMAEIARKRGMEVNIGTAETADFGDGEYDTILFNGSPSYISDLKSVVKKAYRALHEGGKLILIDVPKESSYGMMYNLAKALGTWHHPLLEGVYPPNPYPIELVDMAHWRTTREKLETMDEAGFKELSTMQTLTKHPLYSDLEEEQPSAGYDKGDYVAAIGVK